MYEIACDGLNAAGIQQYEISNFARPGFESKHNLKYWTRQPYIGFGVDAHSMLLSRKNALAVIRFATTDSLENFEHGSSLTRTDVSQAAALEEEFFLGLRLNRGVDLDLLSKQYGGTMQALRQQLEELISAGLLSKHHDAVALNAKGRLLSNEVFERLINLRDVILRTPPRAKDLAL